MRLQRLVFFIHLVVFSLLTFRLVLPAEAYITHPYSLIWAINEEVYVIDLHQNVIKVYDPNLQFIRTVNFYPLKIEAFYPSHDGLKVAIELYDRNPVDMESSRYLVIRTLPDFASIPNTKNIAGSYHDVFWHSDNVHLIGKKSHSNTSSWIVVVNTKTGLTEKEVLYNPGIRLFTIQPETNQILLSIGNTWSVQDIFGTGKITSEIPRNFGASYSPSGEYVALARDFTEIEILETETYSLIQTITAPTLNVYEIDWSVAGLLVTSFDWHTYLFDPLTGEVLWTIPSGYVESFAWNTDGTRFYKMDSIQGTTAHDGSTGAFIARLMPDVIATYTPNPKYPIPTADFSTYSTPISTQQPS